MSDSPRNFFVFLVVPDDPRSRWMVSTSVSSSGFDCSICDWEYTFFIFHIRYHFLCIESSSSDASISSCSSNVRDHDVSFEIRPRVQGISKEKTKQDFWSKFI